MLFLARLPQKCLLGYSLPCRIHGELWTLSSFRRIEQSIKVNSGKMKPCYFNSLLFNRKHCNIEVLDDSELELSHHPGTLSLKLDKNKSDWNVNAKYNNDNGTKDLRKAFKIELRKKKAVRRQYVLDHNAAQTLVTHLNKDLEETDIIVESSPGPGVLTNALLTRTNNNIIAYEPHDAFRTNLEISLLPQYSSRLQIHSLDLEKFYSYYISDRKAPEKNVLHELMYPITTKGNGEISPVKIVGSIVYLKFFIRLVLSFAFQCCFYEKIWPVLYLYIPHTIFKRLTSDVKNFKGSSISILFRFYFNLEYLDVAYKNGFYLPFTQDSRDRSKEANCLCLVKISPNKNLFKKVPKKELERFHYFMNTMCRIKKNDTLLMCLERWIPGCGPQLIKNGLHVFCHPREMTQEQLLRAYRIFIRLPFYDESVFHHQCRQFVTKFGEKVYEVSRLKTEEKTIHIEDEESL
ncbi:dimethyladenosine transferase 2, mitochondrial [Procambarus clarkii]|uniref:dimethyladenosine transferase 2, mitochondrial n=1 Tax=Procambarus clarkii TaxID=6728 RepID=UPI001E6723EA|nr:dimethyladenosine transferase 2, mitochondrial-like [Procambarus clarkii]XP_045592790.1 dimethyladenosine transferase 2, mitochondrial-like [Procambarus clarkii]